MIRNKELYFKEYNCEKEVKEFADYVLKTEGYKDTGWTMIYKGETTDSICLHSLNEIHMGKAWLFGIRVLDSKIYVLHEIAHIKTHPEDNWHGDLFQQEHLRLINKYLIKQEG